MKKWCVYCRDKPDDVKLIDFCGDADCFETICYTETDPDKFEKACQLINNEFYGDYIYFAVIGKKKKNIERLFQYPIKYNKIMVFDDSLLWIMSNFNKYTFTTILDYNGDNNIEMCNDFNDKRI
jgi:hypothetical protein